jgi:hypothetical protein
MSEVEDIVACLQTQTKFKNPVGMIFRICITQVFHELCPFVRDF